MAKSKYEMWDIRCILKDDSTCPENRVLYTMSFSCCTDSPEQLTQGSYNSSSVRQCPDSQNVWGETRTLCAGRRESEYMGGGFDSKNGVP